MKYLFYAFFSDLNECEEWGYCDQKCENVEYGGSGFRDPIETGGSGFRCSCVEGYELKDATRNLFILTLKS